jgi:hypothetical protein
MRMNDWAHTKLLITLLIAQDVRQHLALVDSALASFALRSDVQHTSIRTQPCEGADTRLLCHRHSMHSLNTEHGWSLVGLFRTRTSRMAVDMQ